MVHQRLLEMLTGLFRRLPLQDNKITAHESGWQCMLIATVPVYCRGSSSQYTCGNCTGQAHGRQAMTGPTGLERMQYETVGGGELVG